MIRLAPISHVYEGFQARFLTSLCLAVLAVLFPLQTAVAATATFAVIYALLGLSRPTFLLAYPSLFVMPLVFGAGIFGDEFEWGGHRYRLNDAGAVDVLG